MNTQSLYRVGIVLYALVIGFFGVNHFLNGTGFQHSIPSFIPYHIFWVYVTGAALIAVAICFLTGKYMRAAGWYLAIYLIVIVFTIHLPALIRTENTPIVSIALTNLVKDTGLAAGALLIAARGTNP